MNTDCSHGIIKMGVILLFWYFDQRSNLHLHMTKHFFSELIKSRTIKTNYKPWAISVFEFLNSNILVE